MSPIRPLVPLHASIGSMSMSPMDPVDRIDRPLVPHAPIGSMSALKTLSLSPKTVHADGAFRDANPTLALLTLLAIPMPRLIQLRPTIAARDPFLSSVFHRDHDVASLDSADSHGALIQSLFQYSHPVLSRPTVPNIDT